MFNLTHSRWSAGEVLQIYFLRHSNRKDSFFEKVRLYNGVKLFLTMDDQMDISSTTPSYGFQHEEEELYRADKHKNSLMDEGTDFLEREADANILDDDDILDLVGGAKDALERHSSTLPRTEEPLLNLPEPEPEPSSTSKPEPEAVKPAPSSAFGDATTKTTKSEEKDEKTRVTSKSNSCCSCKYIMHF